MTAQRKLRVEEKEEASDGLNFNAELIYGFTTTFLLSKFDNPVPTPAFHLELWDLFCQEARRVSIAAPRGHAKSTACTHSYTLANICFRQRKHILIVSDTESQAIDFLRDIRNELVENEPLRETFQIECLEKDNEKEIIGKFKDGSRFRVIAKGSEQKLRGIKWRNTRPDLIIGDDLENDEIVMNEERRVKFQKWFLNALLPCGSKTAIVRIVGTILHMDSLLENLMPTLEHPATVTSEDGLRDHWDEDLAKEYATSHGKEYNPRAWRSYRYRAHPSANDFSAILWREQYDAERLRSIRNEYVEQGHPDGYSQEYLNYPLDEENAYFRKEDFKPFPEGDVPLTYYIAGDLAISEKDLRAYTVFVVAGMDAWGNLRVCNVDRFRGDSLEIIDRMFSLCSIYDPDIFFLEQENIARALGPVLFKEMEERGRYLPIKEMTASQDKIKRARPLQSRMRAGKVQFDQDASWYAGLFNEMTQFPRGKYKDQVDALAWIALGLETMQNAPTRAEYEDYLYEEELEESTTFYDLGANGTTGY